MPDLDYFIDTHCHMFTIADIPLYEMIRQKAEDYDGLGGKVARVGIGLFGPLAGLLSVGVDLDGMAEEYEGFIRFFENEPSDSVRQICDEFAALVAAGGSDGYRFSAANTIITPVIMDMDKGGNIRPGKKSKVDAHADRLIAAIAEVNPAAKVLPFWGIDLRRDQGDFAERLSRITTIRERGGIASTYSGDFVGLKLYPALGFDPDRHINKLQQVAERDIPITVHCQKGGPKMLDDINDLTNPGNWASVLAQCPNLRINFAHFGGEGGVIDSINFDFDDSDAYPHYTFNFIKDHSWTLKIVHMLKKYKNTYADISAFDYADEKAAWCLRWLLTKEKNGELDDEYGPYRLADKLMWGTDYPMVLTTPDMDYTKIFEGFLRALTSEYDGLCTFPPAFDDDFVEELVTNMVCENPKKFLGDSDEEPIF